jgi:hypothetical protein
MADAPTAIAAMFVTGGRLFALGVDATLYVHENGALRGLRQGTQRISSRTQLSISRDGRRLGIYDEGKLAVVDVATGGVWLLAEHTRIGGIALTPDGRYLIASEALHELRPRLMRFAIEPPSATPAWIRSVTNAKPPAGPRTPIEWKF